MNRLLDLAREWLDPNSIAGAAVIGALVFVLASIAVVLIRRSTRRIGRHLSDTTVLRFASLLVQLLVWLIGVVLYAHLIPELRAFGTALLAGASVVSVVLGLAAQDTLGNLIAGLSLVLSRTLRVGDAVRLYSPVGMISAKVKLISLGYTVLADEQDHEVVVPNNVMLNSAVMRLEKSP